ncbi:MAG: XRE family transcriptional regulator [Syntrophomonadaceae bacterium]
MKNDLGQLITRIRRDQHLSLRKLAALTGLSRTYLNNLEKGVDPSSGKPVTPSLPTLRKLATGLSVPLHELIALAESSHGNSGPSLAEMVASENFHELHGENIRMVPIVGTIAAGKPSVMENEIEAWAPIDLTLSNIIPKDLHRYYYLRIQGDSMEPMINEQDIVLVKQGPVPDGKIAVVQCDDQNACVKRIHYLHGQSLLMLISRNAAYPPIVKPLEECKVLGRVVMRMGAPRW